MATIPNIDDYIGSAIQALQGNVARAAQRNIFTEGQREVGFIAHISHSLILIIRLNRSIKTSR